MILNIEMGILIKTNKLVAGGLRPAQLERLLSLSTCSAWALCLELRQSLSIICYKPLLCTRCNIARHGHSLCSQALMSSALPQCLYAFKLLLTFTTHERWIDRLPEGCIMKDSRTERTTGHRHRCLMDNGCSLRDSKRCTMKCTADTFTGIRAHRERTTECLRILKPVRVIGF